MKWCKKNKQNKILYTMKTREMSSKIAESFHPTLGRIRVGNEEMIISFCIIFIYFFKPVPEREG